MAQEIDWLRKHVECQRAEFQVPGVAIGAVLDGEVVLAEGFGQRDVANDLPVTPTTPRDTSSNSSAVRRGRTRCGTASSTPSG